MGEKHHAAISPLKPQFAEYGASDIQLKNDGASPDCD